MTPRFAGLVADMKTSRIPAPPPLPRPTLGQRIQAVPNYGGDEHKLAWGTVTYIHGTHHWYQVTFDAGYRQSYQWGCTR